MEIADLLVKLLVPYLKNGKITDKPSFKVLAREFTHLLIKSRVGSSSKIGKLIAKFFSLQAASVNEANAKILVREFSISSTKWLMKFKILFWFLYVVRIYDWHSNYSFRQKSSKKLQQCPRLILQSWKSSWTKRSIWELTEAVR